MSEFVSHVETMTVARGATARRNGCRQYISLGGTHHCRDAIEFLARVNLYDVDLSGFKHVYLR